MRMTSSNACNSSGAGASPSRSLFHADCAAASLAGIRPGPIIARTDCSPSARLALSRRRARSRGEGASCFIGSRQLVLVDRVAVSIEDLLDEVRTVQRQHRVPMRQEIVFL